MKAREGTNRDGKRKRERDRLTEKERKRRHIKHNNKNPSHLQ